MRTIINNSVIRLSLIGMNREGLPVYSHEWKDGYSYKSVGRLTAMTNLRTARKPIRPDADQRREQMSAG